MMRSIAHYVQHRGIGCAIMELPYHLHRRPKGMKPGAPFRARDPKPGIQALGQSASDVSTVVSWLRDQPSVDPEKVGVTGISLGAIISHLAMGKDDRLSAGVAILGGGDLVYLRRHSFLWRFQKGAGRLGRESREAVSPVDPLTYAEENRPRRVFMLQAARDLIVPPHCGRVLWRALGKPPIQWTDTGHAGPILAQRSVLRTSVAYLDSVWEGKPLDSDQLPRVRVPTIKVGMLFGLDSVVTPAVQWQAYSFLQRRDHMSLLHLDLGWSGRGPFLGLATTLNGFVDLGVGHRLTGNTIRPYASVHIVY